MRQVVLDTETTGLQVSDGHKIIEIGCVELVNRKLTGNRYHYYLNPQREIDEGALAVHGISNEFLKDKPLFAEVADELIGFISNAELIIHNAAFDVGFIDYELSQVSKKLKSLKHYCRITDTLQLARQLHVGQRNSLDALCKRYGIDNSHREMHGALLDAHLLARVYLAMTGGQGSLFDEVPSVPAAALDNSQSISVPHANQKNLRVLKANAEELILHREQLEKLSKKGKCVWEAL